MVGWVCMNVGLWGRCRLVVEHMAIYMWHMAIYTGKALGAVQVVCM